MKKIISIILFLFIVVQAFPQLDYRIYRVNRCKFTDTGIVLLRETFPMRLFFKADSLGYRIYGDYRISFTDLSDKIIDTTEDCQVLSYMARGPKNEAVHVAFRYRKSEDNLVFGVFPFDGDERFTEYYLLPLRERKKKKSSSHK